MQAWKGCLDCSVQVEAQFGLLRAFQGRRVECRMQYEDITNCFKCSESSFVVLACFIDEKNGFRMQRLTEGLETELSDGLQRYLLGDLFGEGAFDFESRDDMCGQKWGGVRTLKEFESNDLWRQFLGDNSWKICALQNPLHIQTFVQLDPPARPKRGRSNANAVAEVGTHREYPCRFSPNRFGFSNFTRSSQRLWNLLLIPKSIWHEMGWYISWCTKVRIVTTRRGRAQALKMKPRPCPKAK